MSIWRWCADGPRSACVALCCSLILAFSATAAAEENRHCQDSGPLVFGILPFISAEQLVVRFTPLANYLSDKLQVPVRIETAPNFIEFARRTHQGRRYDILFTAPHFYSQANQKAGYRLVASIDSPGMWAVIAVPVHSDIQTVQDLKGKRVATVHPMALATLLLRKHLADAGIDPDVDLSLIITPSHDASLLSTFHGVTDASALMFPPYDAASQRVQESMRIIARTESTPHIPISVGPWVAEACATDIQSLLLNMASTEEGKVVLRHNRSLGFTQEDTDVYDRLNQLLYQ